MIPHSINPSEGGKSGHREHKRDAFVAAARELFFAQGYAGTAMSSVAAKVGGSKTTLWTYFPSKEDLFAAVVDQIARQYAKALTVTFDETEPLSVALQRFGEAMMETVQSPAIVELQRLVIGEAARFPELGRLFWERGPGPGKAKLAQLITRRMAAGELRAGDPMVATMQFAGMCQMGPHQMHMMGLIPVLTSGERSQIVAHAADSFLRAWRREDEWSDAAKQPSKSVRDGADQTSEADARAFRR